MKSQYRLHGDTQVKCFAGMAHWVHHGDQGQGALSHAESVHGKRPCIRAASSLHACGNCNP